ncbi:MAG: hypothetical protein AAFX81_01515 [Pseudomonadota bacterium]
MIASRATRAAAAHFVSSVFLVASVGGAVAADQQNPPRSAGDAAAQLLSIVGFAGLPDVTASRLNTGGTAALDDQRIDVIRLANDISLGSGENGGPRLYLEGNLGFARSTIDLRLGDTVQNDVTFDGLGAFGSIGPDFPVVEWLRFRPTFVLGLGYVDDDFGLPGEFSNDPTPGIDLRQFSGAIGAAASLDYERPFGGDFLDLRLKATYVHLGTLSTADARFAGSTNNVTVNANAVYKYDTGFRPLGQRLLLTGLLGANSFLGDQERALGFSWFGEFGGGLELDLAAMDAAVKRARVRVTGIAGDNVTGISFGVGIGF